MWLWGRDLTVTECPVSYITAESAALLEEFYAHEALAGASEVLDWPARRVDAFFLLQAEKKKREANA